MWWLSLRNSPKLKEKQEIFVQRSQLWCQRQVNRIPCDESTRRINNRATSSIEKCSEKFLLYNRTCLIEEPLNKYRVIQYGASRPKTTKCPINGGFHFRTVHRLINEEICDDWRISSLEIECIEGDGLHFIAPKGSSCNPFSVTEEKKRLRCWAGWEHSQYYYLVVAEDGEIPQYCLRFPKKLHELSEFTVMLYFSVVCPTLEDGKPQSGMDYYEMKMKKIDPMACADENKEKCIHIAKRGACHKENKFAVHCQESCGLCDEKKQMLRTSSPFSGKLHGTWILMDHRPKKEHVFINHSTVTFSEFGTFVCKEWNIYNEHQYKTVSFFKNGCAMRYTCVELHRLNNNLVQFRVGNSFRVDVGFEELCNFDGAVFPVNDPYRGANLKNLILDGNLWDTPCGFSGTIPFNGTVYGEPCEGVISDWDEIDCVEPGAIRISSDSCRNLMLPRVYQCLAVIQDNLLEKYLITKETIAGVYNCWIVTSFLCTNSTWKYRAMFKLSSPQCSTFTESACLLDRSPEALLYLNDGQKTKYCKDALTIKPMTWATENKRIAYTTYIPPEGVPENPDATVYSGEGSPSRDSNIRNSAERYQYYQLPYTAVFIFIFYCKIT
ncbi:hypothetical protein ACJMK2_033266 [Sinanodonta woodiana]|uniref:ShKT domain-containing protein n=1 Tax=Sinanodonta woodiana TaxID=1069815 RepID=A0ABD3X5T2_SINWO